MTHTLVPHRSGAAQDAVLALVARVEASSATTLLLEYRLTGDLARLAIPRRLPAQRADRLWEHTCFEAFVAPSAGQRYYELNFSPSTHWAGYAFDGYRQDMRPLTFLAPPSIVVVHTPHELRVTASVELASLPDAPWPWRVGLAAVVENYAGGRGYFALRHPRDKPDFHDAAGFTVLLDGSAR
jgi:hypothetical protein